MTVKNLVACVALLVLMAAIANCGSVMSERLAQARAMKPSGDAFQIALWKGYIQKVDTTKPGDTKQAKDIDFRSAELFIDKAMMAAKGQTPLPEEPSKYKFHDPATANELRTALVRLNAAFAGNGTQKAPAKAAESQVAYDCWLEEALEGLEPAKIRECREKFLAEMDGVEAVLNPVAAAPAPAPTPAPIKMPGPYVVYFEWNSSGLDKAAMAVINQVAADVRTAKPSVIKVTGYSDTAGTPADNLKRSQKRAEVVAAALRKAGVTVLVAISSVGADELAIPTGPNVREPRNRRVVIAFGK